MNDNEYYPYAYSKKGQRYYEAHPGHRSKRLSMIGAWCNRRFIAPFMFEGHCNTKLFEIYLAKILIPQLKPGSNVIMDNASFHKSQNIQNLIKNAKCQLLYLPPYSPDFNPIEKFWNKAKNVIKKKMRKAAQSLDDAMLEALNRLSIAL